MNLHFDSFWDFVSAGASGRGLISLLAVCNELRTYVRTDQKMKSFLFAEVLKYTYISKHVGLLACLKGKKKITQ